MTRLWILGASDPEMAAIEQLLAQCGEEYAIATIDGRRVHPGNAYQAVHPLPSVWSGREIILVECGYDPRVKAPANRCARCGDYQWGDWAGYADLGDDGQPVAGGMGYCGDLHEWVPTMTVADHHRPGDPGYGRPPSEFLAASSLGQVISRLGQVVDYPSHWERVAVGRHPHWCGAIERDGNRWAVRTTGGDGDPGQDDEQSATAAIIPVELVLAAAADHCLAAAYRGECPSVDPDELMRWRIASRAAFQGRPEADVLADVQRARDVLRSADMGFLNALDAHGTCRGCGEDVSNDYCTCPRCADLRGLDVPELPEAAAREGICFLASVRERDGREKVVCQAGTPEQIRAFMEVWAPANGLTGIYGDPARGFAGGYR